MNNRHSKSYDKALRDIRSDFSSLERLLSRLVHARILWHTSKIIEISLLRFTPLLLGYLFALAAGLVFISLIFVFNYSLNSLHALFVFFVLGYMVGVIIDYIKLLSRH